MYLDPLLPSASIGEKDKWENREMVRGWIHDVEKERY